MAAGVVFVFVGFPPSARAEPSDSLAWVTRDAGGAHVVVGPVRGARQPIGGGDGFAEHRRPSWSPDGRYLLYEAGAGDSHCDFCRLKESAVFVARSDGPSVPVRIGPGAFAAWSPDGTSIAYDAGPEDGLEIVDVATGAVRRVDTASYHDCVAWSPDSRRIVSIVPGKGETGPGGFQRQDVRIVDRDGRVIASYPTDIARICPVFSPDGSRVAFRTDSPSDERLAVASAVSRSEPVPVDGPACAQDIDPAWSRSGLLAMARTFTEQGECSQVGGPCGDLDPCRRGIWQIDLDGSATLIAAVDQTPTGLTWNDASSVLAFELPAVPCPRCDYVAVVHFVTPHGDVTELDDGSSETFQPRFRPTEGASVVPWFDRHLGPTVTRPPGRTGSTSSISASTSVSSIDDGHRSGDGTPPTTLEAGSRDSRRGSGSRAHWPVTAAGAAIASAAALLVRSAKNRRRAGRT